MGIAPRCLFTAFPPFAIWFFPPPFSLFHGFPICLLLRPRDGFSAISATSPKGCSVSPCHLDHPVQCFSAEMITVAEQIGQTPHLSPLLRRLRSVGLTQPDDLRRLAVARGCWHYRRPDDDLKKECSSPVWENVSDVELAMGMLTAAQRFDPVLVRCAAQLLSGDRISIETIVRLAVQERAVPVVRHIASAGAALDSETREKWQRLLAMLPAGPEVIEGRLPHRTRFVSEGGLFRRNGHLDRTGHRAWLRPRQYTQS